MMKRINFFSLLAKCLPVVLILASGSSIAGNIYDVSNIPEHLKEDAIAVMRQNHRTFEVTSERRASYTEHRVITILERRAEGLADLFISYDDFRRVRNVTGTIYDANGNKVRDLRNHEFIDRSAASAFSLYEDNRIIYTDIYQSQLPFTVEFEYEVEYRRGFFFPDWFPQQRAGVAVEQASFTIITPRDMDYRYKAYNHDDMEPVVTMPRSRMVSKWKLEDLSAIKYESHMPPFHRMVPYLLVGSNEFQYDRVPGDMRSWEEYGKWFASLNEGRQSLPGETRQKLHAMTEGIDDPMEKTRIVYEYMQSRTRYVSIQLGIGGFQPFDAESVDETGYGDCKALVNYTQAMLNEVGIRSYYTLIHYGAARIPVKPEFPAKAFNHAILCVPLGQDTLWLECTDNRIPMGFIGSNNANRHVLLITPEGGKLTRTPSYGHDGNHRQRNIRAYLRPNQQVEFEKTTHYKGLRLRDRFGISFRGSGDQIRYYQEHLPINNPEILEISFSLIPGETPSLEEYIHATTNQYVSRAGARVLLQPNIISRMESVPPVTRERVHPVHVSASGLYTDTVRWEVPDAFEISFIPEDIEIDNDFGYYKASYKIDDRVLLYSRQFYTRSGTHPPERYEAFIEFKHSIRNADRAQVVLTR
ncbi:MAG: DUF3857 domain-containing protein [Bacteroidia bacterium]|nr:MAG: DUF3857 domain-containing protein [Bacteroidia bacterium]